MELFVLSLLIHLEISLVITLKCNNTIKQRTIIYEHCLGTEKFHKALMVWIQLTHCIIVALITPQQETREEPERYSVKLWIFTSDQIPLTHTLRSYKITSHVHVVNSVQPKQNYRQCNPSRDNKYCTCLIMFIAFAHNIV